MVKSFYIFLLLCLGYTVCVYNSYLASFDISSLDSYKLACLLQLERFPCKETDSYALLLDNSKVGYLKIILSLFCDWGQFSDLKSYNSCLFQANCNKLYIEICLSSSFIFPTMYHLVIFDFSTMFYKSLKLFTFFWDTLYLPQNPSQISENI